MTTLSIAGESVKVTFAERPEDRGDVLGRSVAVWKLDDVCWHHNDLESMFRHFAIDTFSNWMRSLIALWVDTEVLSN